MTETYDTSYIALTIKKFRASRSLCLGDLADISGVSRSMICQIEAGKTVPTINVLWKLAKAMETPIADLVDPGASQNSLRLVKATECPRVVSPDGSYVAHAVSAGSLNRQMELYRFHFEKIGQNFADAHPPGTTAYLVVDRGEVDLEVAGERKKLGPGDSVELKASVPYLLEQVDPKRLSKGTLVVNYRL